MTNLPPRIASKLQKVDSGCWLWTASLRGGYGQIWMRNADGRRHLCAAHRVVYEMLVSPIPDGLDIDHLCRNPQCVNPAHLEPVTRKTNVLRGKGLTATNAAKVRCMHGHEFTPENTIWRPTGARLCRVCTDVYQRAYRKGHPHEKVAA